MLLNVIAIEVLCSEKLRDCYGSSFYICDSENVLK